MLIRFFKDLEGFLAIARDSLKDYWPSFRYLWDLWELLAFSRGRYGFLRVTQPNFGHSHPVFGHLRPLWRGSRRHFSLLSSSEQFFLLLFRWADRKLLTFLARCFEFYEAFEHFPTLPKMISLSISSWRLQKLRLFDGKGEINAEFGFMGRYIGRGHLENFAEVHWTGATDRLSLCPTCTDFFCFLAGIYSHSCIYYNKNLLPRWQRWGGAAAAAAVEGLIAEDKR